MKKKLLSLLLALTLCVGLGIPALADTEITYPHLAIGENGLYSMDSEHNPRLSKNSSGAGWSWNAASYTLTLDNVNQPSLSLQVNLPEKPVTVVVKGTNTMSDLSVAGNAGTLTGSGTLSLSGRCDANVSDGPTVNCGGDLFIATLKSGTVSGKNPIPSIWSMFDVQGGCRIIDAKEYFEWKYREFGRLDERDSAICFSDENLPEAFFPGCTLTDENGSDVTLKRENYEMNGKTYTRVTAVKADGSPATYVKITAAGYTPFADVKSGDWFAAPVAWAVEKGITDGTSDTTFSPDDTCTRGEIITFLWRAAGCPEPNNVSAFSDVNADMYYAKASAWAKENGMASGDTFSPEAPCTRLMAVEFMWKHAGSPDAAAASFGDVSSPAVNWAVEKSVTNGTSDTTFSPDDTCTRGQIVTFLYRGFGE